MFALFRSRERGDGLPLRKRWAGPTDTGAEGRGDDDVGFGCCFEPVFGLLGCLGGKREPVILSV